MNNNRAPSPRYIALNDKKLHMFHNESTRSICAYLWELLLMKANIRMRKRKNLLDFVVVEIPIKSNYNCSNLEANGNHVYGLDFKL